MNTDVRLSVDLGTTWTAAGVSRGGAPESVSLGADGAAMPSVVAVSDGTIVAGNAAVRIAATDPSSSAREFKRRLGDTAPIVLGGTPYGAETLMGHLLGHVVATVTEKVGAPATVTLTHPAVFGEYKLDLMREAARVAGVGSVSLLSEPEAAALHYARLGRLAVGDAVAVYDFGGGTFDAAVVRLEANGPRLLGRPEGLERLGGIDLDAAVLAHVDASLDGALSQLDTADPDVRRAVLALRQDCVIAKETLSVDTEVTVAVTIPGLNTAVRVTRSEFESFVRPRLGETLGALDRAIASTDLNIGDLAGVVLVGGSSRIPLVVEQVAAHTGRPLLTDADPKLVVVLGAVPVRDQPVALEEDAMSTTTPPPAGSEPAATPSTGAPAAAKDAAKAASKGSAKERRTDPGQRDPEKGGMSTAGKVAAGVAAAGLAGATAAFWRDDIENAVGLGDDDDDQAPPEAGVDEVTVAAAAAVPTTTPVEVEAEESLDAFDAVAEAPAGAGFAARSGGPAGGGGGGGGASGGGGGGASSGGGGASSGAGATAAPPRPAPTTAAPAAAATTAATAAPAAAGQAAAATSSAPPPPMGTQTESMEADVAIDPAFESARAELAQRLDAWQPPEGADAEEVADLRARLDGLLDRYEPQPGQSVDDAIAQLRDEFDLRIDNFTQDQRIDALIEEAATGGGGMPAMDPEFESRRDALRESLETWQAPEGTSPEDAAELKAQLQTLVDSYQPGAGQTADEALAALRAQFDDQVEDFTQDQRIDALIDEVEDLRDSAGMPAMDPEFESRRDALRESLESWQAPEGTSPEDAAELREQLQTLVDSYQPGAGQTADEALAALRAQFDDQVQDFTQDQRIDALVDAQMAENEAEGADLVDGGEMMTAEVMPEDLDDGALIKPVAPADDAGGEFDPRVSMPADALDDPFDEMIADPIPVDVAPGFAIGEPDPSAPIPAPGDEDFSTPDPRVTMPVPDDDIFAVADLATDPTPVADTVGAIAEPAGIWAGPGEELLDTTGADPLDLVTTTPDDLAPWDADQPDDLDLGISLSLDDDDADLDGGMTADQMDDPLSGI